MLKKLYPNLPIDDLPKELLAALPEEKFDIGKIRQLEALEFTEIVPIIPHLLTWLQDMNWPIAKPMVAFLLKGDEEMVGPVREILKGDDEKWQLWVLEYLVSEWKPALMASIQPDLKELATRTRDVDVSEILSALAFKTRTQ